MSKFECCTCGKKSDNGKDFYTVGARVGSNRICKECATELGYNFFTAGLTNNTRLLKKYVKLHPEVDERLNHQMLLIGKANLDAKAEINKMMADSLKHAGCKKKEQTKCTCQSCGMVYYFSQDDELLNAANILHGSVYSLNKFKDLNKCPKCGSLATVKKKVYVWIDKKNNCVDVEE